MTRLLHTEADERYHVALAHLEERRLETPKALGSIPGGHTMKTKDITLAAAHAEVTMLKGWSVTGGAAAAHVRLRKGGLITDPIVAEVVVGANESETIVFGHGSAIPCPGGVFVEDVTGTMEGVLYWD